MKVQWERGYRCHGLWCGTQRLGAVGLPPFGPVREYRWSVDRTGEAGTVRTLKQAKRAVENRIMANHPIMVWNTALVWEDLTPPGIASAQWRCEIGGGFWLHVNRKLDVGATYTATVKHAGGLCASKAGFRKFSRRDIDIPLVKWAKATATKFTREMMERMEKIECPASPTTQ